MPVPNDLATSTPSAPGEHRLLTSRLSVMMFLQYASLGMWSVTLGTYITKHTGDAGRKLFDSDFVGDLLTTQALGAMMAPVLFGVIADRHFSTEKLLSLLHIAAAACLCLMATSDRQWVFYVGALVYFQVYAPTGALSSTLALRHLPGGQQGFPLVRSMGTIGWIAAGLFVGVVWRSFAGASIEATVVPMWLAVGCHLLMGIYAFTLPPTPALGRMAGGWRALAGGGNLWRNRSFVVLIVLSALVMAPAQFYNGFAHPFLSEQGLGFQDAASWLTLGQAGEVFIMLLLPVLLLRFRLKTLFLCGAVAWAARFLCFALSESGSAWLAYAAILIHGVAFVFVYLTGQLYIDRLADRDARAAAQGVHSTAVFGVGSLVGSLATGAAQNRYLTPPGVSPPPYDWSSFWMASCVMSVVGAVLFALLFRESPAAEHAGE